MASRSAVSVRPEISGRTLRRAVSMPGTARHGGGVHGAPFPDDRAGVALGEYGCPPPLPQAVTRREP